jgi:hypothetical protein
MEVARVDDVEVDDAEGADAGGSQVHGRRGTEAARPDADHASRLELPLPVHADLRHDQVAAVPLHFFACQLRRLLHRRVGPARHRWHDADRVARLERRLLAIEVADVLVVHVDVDEAAELSVIVVQMTAQIAVPGDKRLEQLADGTAVELHDILPVGERPERCRDQNPMGHDMSSRRTDTVRSRRRHPAPACGG